MKLRPLTFTPPVTPDQLVSMVLGAYYEAVADCRPPPDDDDPATWADAACFADLLEQLVERRLGVLLYGELPPLPDWPPPGPFRQVSAPEQQPGTPSQASVPCSCSRAEGVTDGTA